MISLAANENPLGMPESAAQAIRDSLQNASAYPDENGVQLKAALAQRLNVDPSWIVLGSGSSELLELAAQAFVKPGQQVVFSQYGFIVYGKVTHDAHAKARVVPARNHGHDLAAMHAAIDADTALVFVANPNNPTGNFIGADELRAFISSVPAHVTVLLDEAYTEYLTPGQRYDSMQWVREFPNLVVTRTFSKAYGLAGLRVGYVVSQPALATRLNARRARFNLTTPALAAARAALADAAFLQRTYESNLAGREQLAAGFDALGLVHLPSAGNFVMVQIAGEGGAAAMHQHLHARGIAVSRLDPYGLASWLRVSVGLPEQNAQVLAAMREHLQQKTHQQPQETHS